MKLILSHASEKSDAHSKTMRFIFHDTELNHYKAEVPESSEHWSRWYSLFLSHLRAHKENKTIRISNIALKNVIVLPESQFKIEILENNKTWVPIKKTQLVQESNPNAKKYVIRKDTDL